MFQESGRADSQATKKLFVGGLRDNIGENELREYFSSYGDIEIVDLLTDKVTGRKRGFGFITFDDYDAVERICSTYHKNLNSFTCIK